MLGRKKKQPPMYPRRQQQFIGRLPTQQELKAMRSDAADGIRKMLAEAETTLNEQIGAAEGIVNGIGKEITEARAAVAAATGKEKRKAQGELNALIKKGRKADTTLAALVQTRTNGRAAARAKLKATKNMHRGLNG